MSATTKLMAFSYLGGKNYHLDWMLPLLECVNAFGFVDVFGGAFTVSLNIRPHRVMTVNDINGEIVNFFRVLRTDHERLHSLLEVTPYSRQEYYQCAADQHDEPVERARKFFVRAMQSRFSLGIQRHSAGWNAVTNSSETVIAATVNRWLNKIAQLPELVERLKMVQIENRDFRDVIRVYQGKNTLIYCDPTYPHESRKGTKDYAFEMSDADHRDLADILHAAPGYKAISGYDCDLMRELYGDWYLHKAAWSTRNIAQDDRQECLWTSYNPDDYNAQQKLF